MLEINKISTMDLKKMHKEVCEKIDCAKEDISPENKWMRAINPNYNQVKAEGLVVLRMIDDALEERGFNVEKLFKDYKKINYFKN